VPWPIMKTRLTKRPPTEAARKTGLASLGFRRDKDLKKWSG